MSNRQQIIVGILSIFVLTTIIAVARYMHLKANSEFGCVEICDEEHTDCKEIKYKKSYSIVEVWDFELGRECMKVIEGKPSNMMLVRSKCLPDVIDVRDWCPIYMSTQNSND